PRSGGAIQNSIALAIIDAVELLFFLASTWILQCKSAHDPCLPEVSGSVSDQRQAPRPAVQHLGAGVSLCAQRFSSSQQSVKFHGKFATAFAALPGIIRFRGRKQVLPHAVGAEVHGRTPTVAVAGLPKPLRP